MAARAKTGGCLSSRASRIYESKCSTCLTLRAKRADLRAQIYISNIRSFSAANLAACTFDVDLLLVIRNIFMKTYTLVFLFGAHLVLGGCAATSNQFNHGAVSTQSPQPSQASAGHNNSTENSDSGLTILDTVDAAQDITQTAREAKSTVYEVKRTINELKGLMDGW